MRLRLALLAFLCACPHRPPPPEPIDIVLSQAQSNDPYVLSDHRGQPMVVYFFTTWCIPCQVQDAEMAEAVRQGVHVVGIALDLEGATLVVPWVRATNPPYPVLLGGGRVAEGRSSFGQIPELPALVFLDSEGRAAAALSGVIEAGDIVERVRVIGER